MMTKIKAIVLFAGVCAVAFGYGCILNPDQGGGGGDKPPIVWKDLTQKEDVIENLIHAYNGADMTHYTQLLRDDYTWVMQDADVKPGEEQWRTKDWDIKSTTNMFLSTRGQNPTDPLKNIDQLNLEIESGAWMQVDTVPGLPAPCVDCWVTTRLYTVKLILTGGENGFIGNDLVQIMVVPVEEGGKKLYKIYRMDDIARQQ